MLDRQLEQAIQQSAQTTDINRVKKPAEVFETGDFWFDWITQPDILPAWGTRNRDRRLRQISYQVHNSLFQGAVSGLIMHIQATPWEITGGRNLARYYQSMLQNSDFHDWETWIARLLWDFFTQDFGAVSEVIGGGKEDKPITGKVLGLAQMDSLSCAATKVSQYPIIYTNEEDGSRHLMHGTRVYRLTDMVSPRRLSYGTGLCALSRYISEANVDILLGRHDNEMLSDLPPVGLLAVSGMTKDQWIDAAKGYESDRRADGESVFRGTMVIHSIDPSNPIKMESIPFSALPDKFDVTKFVDMHVNKLALALGVDPQDIWPLSGQALGTGTQSTILHSKAQGKMFGRVLQMITRFINRAVLPEGLEFQFKFKDAEADQETANTAKVWVDIANSATFLSDDEKRQLLANNVEAIADVLLNEAGELIELPDDDPKEDQQEVIVAPDANPNSSVPTQLAVTQNADGNPAPPAANPVPGQGGQPEPERTGGKVRERPRLHADMGGQLHTDYSVATKDYPDTESAFIEALAVIFGDVENGEINRASFSIRMRQALNNYGKAAYTDGLEAGGVTDEWEQSDSDAFASILADKSGYISDASKRLYKEDGSVIGGADYNASLWTVSLKAFYYGGVESADKNGMYTFTGDDGDESCATCQRLKGTSHRMSWWVKNKLRPGLDEDSDNFECKSYNCQHFLEKRAA